MLTYSHLIQYRLGEDNNDDLDEFGEDDDDFEVDSIIATMELGEHDILPTFEEVTAGSIVTIQCYENDVNEQVLEDYHPRYIIMYDPNPAFIRRVEVGYTTRNKKKHSN